MLSKMSYNICICHQYEKNRVCCNSGISSLPLIFDEELIPFVMLYNIPVTPNAAWNIPSDSLKIMKGFDPI